MIILIPFEQVPQEVLAELQIIFHGFCAPEINHSSLISLPHWAYEPLRGQYDAGALLQTLPEGKAHERILGIVDQDLFVPRLNFVFGIADPQGRRALIALHRLRQDCYDLAPDPSLFSLRVAKEAVHELGHIEGLEHCPDTRCAMYFSNTLRDTDQKGYQFCPRCRTTINL